MAVEWFTVPAKGVGHPDYEAAAKLAEITPSVLVVPNNAPAIIKAAALMAKVVFGDRIQICDGVNDHVEIQAALDALPATGGEVKLLDGTYNCEATINLDSYQTLRGGGRNTILTTSTADLVFLSAVGIAGTEKTGIVIADLQIDGDPGIGTTLTVGELVGATDIHVTDTAGFEVGFPAVIDRGGAFEKHFLINNVAVGIITIDAPLANNQGAGETIDVESLGDCGIYFEYVDYSFIQNVYSGRHVSGTGSFQSGIYLRNSDFNQIINNTCQGNSDTGIYLLSSSNNTVVANTYIRNSQVSDNTYDNISLVSSSYNLILGNLCRATTVGATLTVGEIAGATDIHVTDTAGFVVGDGVVLDLGGANVEYHRISAITPGAPGIITIPAPGLTNAQGIGETIDVPEARYGINIIDDTCNRNCLIGNDLYDSGRTGDLNDVPTTNPTLKKANRNLAGTGWLAEV